MQHLDEVELQSYLDSEADESLCRRAEAHIVRCPWCEKQLGIWREVCTRVRESAPAPSSFQSEGAFWVELAAKLDQRRPHIWPLVPYLPPVILGVLSALVQLLVSVVLLSQTLMSLRVIPSLGARAATRLTILLSQPGLQAFLSDRLGLSGPEITNRIIGLYGKVNSNAQDAFVTIAAIALLSIVLGIAVALLFSWALCWSKAARHHLGRR